MTHHDPPGLNCVPGANAAQEMLVKNFAFDASLAANAYANLDGVVSEANPAFLRLWGYADKKEIIGKSIPEFVDDPNEALVIISTLRGKGRWEGDFTARRKDGSTFLANCLTTDVWDEHGKVVGYQATMLDITARKRAEEALRQSEALLSATQSLCKVGGWLWDIEQQSMFWTEETYRIHDYASGSLGTAMQEHVVKSLGCCDEAYRPLILAAFQRCVEHGDPYDIEYAFTSAAGRRLWVRTTAHALRNDAARVIKVIGTIMDITDRKHLEQTLREWNQKLEVRVAERTMELQQSEARLAQLAEATFEGLVISEGGRVVDGNTQLGEILGYDLAEMIGRPVADFVAPESRAEVAERIRGDFDLPYEFNGLRKDGSIIPAEAHASMRIWQGKRTRVTAVRDLTAVKREAAKSLAQQAELEQSQRLALVSEITAGIIHQLGQPLSSIGVNLAAALAKVRAPDLPAAELREILQDIESDVVRIRDTTIHLKALAHPEHPTRVRVDLNHLVANALKLEWHDVVSRQVRFATDFGHDLPPLLANAVQLSHVICILRRNAIEACAECPPARQTVTIRTRRLPGEGLELCVSDAGPGIAPTVMANLFTPFFTTKAEGLGIGLRLCRTIVEAHGGRIEASNNTDGPGATFRVILPELAQ